MTHNTGIYYTHKKLPTLGSKTTGDHNLREYVAAVNISVESMYVFFCHKGIRGIYFDFYRSGSLDPYNIDNYWTVNKAIESRCHNRHDWIMEIENTLSDGCITKLTPLTTQKEVNKFFMTMELLK